MQPDRRFIDAEPEQDSFSLSTGPVGFPIWIDDDDSSQQAPLPSYQPEHEEDNIVEETFEPFADNLPTKPSRSLPERRYATPNPVTPVPPRASAYPPNGSRVRSRFPRSYTDVQQEGEDVTRVPTLPQQTMEQHDTPNYQAESSLPALSLIAIEDASTVQRPPSIDELDTLPPARRRQRDEILPSRSLPQKSWPLRDYYGLHPHPQDISELSTHPFATESERRLRDEHFLVSSDIEEMIEADTLLSHTVAPAEASPVLQPGASQLLISADVRRRGKRQEYRPSFAQHPVDRVRWWLLYPGRLELLLWVAGTALLVAITCVALFLVTISLGILSFGHPGGTPPPASVTQCAAHCDTSTALSPDGLRITLLNTTAPLTSTPIHLRGVGFSPRSGVTLSYDNNRPCSPSTLRADDRGDFTATLTLPTLRPGHHRLVVYDQARKQSVSLDILFTADTGSASGS